MGRERKPGQRQACAQGGDALQKEGVYHTRNPRAGPLWQCAQCHGKELREAGGFQRTAEERAIERFIGCGDPHHGLRCPFFQCFRWHVRILRIREEIR